VSKADYAKTTPAGHRAAGDVEVIGLGYDDDVLTLADCCDGLIAEGDKAVCFTQCAEFGPMPQPYPVARHGPEPAVPALQGGPR
jgi:hypothetical protein